MRFPSTFRLPFVLFAIGAALAAHAGVTYSFTGSDSFDVTNGGPTTFAFSVDLPDFIANLTKVGSSYGAPSGSFYNTSSNAGGFGSAYFWYGLVQNPLLATVIPRSKTGINLYFYFPGAAFHGYGTFLTSTDPANPTLKDGTGTLTVIPSAVPEPAPLVALGLGAVGLLRRRRR